jgi:3-hydroxybutyryl-CoA dehydrogenase
MKVVVITNNDLKQELQAQGMADNAKVDWQEELYPANAADVYIDLLFNGSAERINELKKLQPAIIIVNTLYLTADELPPDFIRINGWKSFLQRPLVETGITTLNKETIENIFACFNKKVEWVPSVPGFITARVISMIINEAYFTLDEKVSSKDEMDTAMKLGTNYPYGPFEWGAIIGLKNVHELLITLARTNSRYTPSDLLKKEALVS